VMFVVGDTLVTPALNDSILAGITRDSILKLARQMAIRVEERKISVDEIRDALKSGAATEAFGTGTAVTIAAIETIGIGDEMFTLAPLSKTSISTRLLDSLNAIKYGHQPGPAGWIVKV
jgi:branched-chain amino acid aminotransferase